MAIPSDNSLAAFTVIYMVIELDNYTALTLSECDVLVVPIHTLYTGFTRHPIPDVKREFPLAYAYVRRLSDARKIKRGKLIFPRGETPKILFLPTGYDYTKKQYLDWVEAGLIKMREYEIHNNYTIAFPALGVYEDDQIDVKRVFRLVKKYLGDGEKDVQFLLNY
jgi:hypothetical protein